jgi:hypothetical protein
LELKVVHVGIGDGLQAGFAFGVWFFVDTVDMAAGVEVFPGIVGLFPQEFVHAGVRFCFYINVFLCKHKTYNKCRYFS